MRVSMSRLVPENKISETRRLAAAAWVSGPSQVEAQEERSRLANETGLPIITAFHPDILAGQGTIGVGTIAAVRGALSTLMGDANFAVLDEIIAWSKTGRATVKSALAISPPSPHFPWHGGGG
ncbi:MULTISPECIES: hypothetical protein [Bradyrhizobium]|uniref:hypothetical protein n=1 Tax=Bradyrhizobium TaxID=374 RepID=UPI00048332C5|nr:MULTISPECIES: hypothetical protein [Bradyrhizobium]UFW51318.1 hypothetical protein BaraCB756_10145 [Bradyrhizobium arachidis]